MCYLVVNGPLNDARNLTRTDRQNSEDPCGVGRKGIEALKRTCDPLGLTCLCSSLVSEPAVTRLLLSTGIMGCRADGRRGDSPHTCALLQLACVGEDGSFKCCMSARSPAAWEHTDHMHGSVGRQAALTATKAIQLCSLGLAQLRRSDSTWKTVRRLHTSNT